MPRATKAESEATAARVLDVARRSFTERGYAGVGLEEIAAEAGVTRGAVYHHFASKLGLFRAVLAGVQATVADEIERATAAVEGDWDQLEIGCRTFLTASTSDEARRVMLVDAPAVLGWNAWREQDAASSGSLLHDVLRRLQDAGRLADVPVEAAAALLSGAMNEAALWIAAESDPRLATGQAWAALGRLLSALRA